MQVQVQYNLAEEDKGSQSASSYMKTKQENNENNNCGLGKFLSNHVAVEKTDRNVDVSTAKVFVSTMLN